MSSSPEFTEKIHFLDISSKLPGYRQSWSPNTFKVRLLLNAKGIPYTEQYISYPDIEPLSKSYGVEPTDTEDMTYTLPAIYHPETLHNLVPGGKIMPESVAIVKHLDTLYPSTPVQAFPEPKSQSEALWTEAENHLNGIISTKRGKGYRLLMPRIPSILDDRGAEYFIRTRTQDHPLDLSPLNWGSADAEDDWTSLRPFVLAYSKFHESTRHAAIASGLGDNGPFLWGNNPTMGDIYLAAILVWFRSASEPFLDRLLAIGEESEPASRKSEGEEVWEKSPMRGVWDAFGREGWLEGVGQSREIPLGNV
ncbi:hypothetical protein QFC22_006305 [Naganishia vaughanmartiniae]|uniref:Uncharacterized protein n=1 Tax=Naganishia vaughanmartiniae TaxID=1424756 RepID=A0ACC2WLA3_9TREE|nr:hypothetical protein QFC22_006305 [Naganishia vaughanmartiniae]